MKEIVELLVNHFKDDRKVALWLSTPNPHLGGTTAINLVKLGRTHKVIQLIKALLEGY